MLRLLQDSEIIQDHLINGRVVQRLALMKVPCPGRPDETNAIDASEWEA